MRRVYGMDRTFCLRQQRRGELVIGDGEEAVEPDATEGGNGPRLDPE